MIQDADDVDGDDRPKRPAVRLLKLLVRTIVLGLVAWGVWRTFSQAGHDLPAYGISWRQLEFGWLAAAAVAYVAGLIPCWIFWHRTLHHMGQTPRWRESLRAFWIGHLGKYVPGKAMVVILRTSLVYSERVSRTVAATRVFVETLTMMAVGAFLASMILVWISPNVWLTLLAIGLMAAAGIPTLPPIFRRIVRMLRVDKANPQVETAIQGVDYPLMATGWLTISLGWLMLGVSLWATLHAVPGNQPPLTDLALLTAAVGLAMVAGFLSLIPGGLGVRDWILVELLVPQYGLAAAFASAILLRVVWLLSELIISGILYGDVWRARRAESDGSSHPAVSSVDAGADPP